MKTSRLGRIILIIFVLALSAWTGVLSWKVLTPNNAGSVEALKNEVLDLRVSLEKTQEALRIQSQYTVQTDSAIMERLKYLYANR